MANNELHVCSHISVARIKADIIQPLSNKLKSLSMTLHQWWSQILHIGNRSFLRTTGVRDIFVEHATGKKRAKPPPNTTEPRHTTGNSFNRNLSLFEARDTVDRLNTSRTSLMTYDFIVHRSIIPGPCSDQQRSER